MQVCLMVFCEPSTYNVDIHNRNAREQDQSGGGLYIQKQNKKIIKFSFAIMKIHVRYCFICFQRSYDKNTENK